MGLSAFKKVAKKSSSKKKKDEAPEFTVSGVLASAHRKWLDGKAKEKDGKATIKKNEGLLLPKAEEEHLKVCQSQDKYYSSIKIVRDEDGKERKLTVSFTNKYSEIPTDSEDDLREIYGGSYDTYFKEQTKVALSDKALNDDSFTDRLVEIVGEEEFEKYFEVKNFIKPTSEYHEHRMRHKDLAKMHQRAVDEGLVKCNKPSIKQG